MKKIGKCLTAVFLAAVLVVSSIVCDFNFIKTDVSAATVTATVTDYVNIRTGPGTSYSRITTLSKGSVVTVNSTSNAAWYNVTTSGGTTGYMYSEYLTLSYSGSTGSGTTTTYVNLRTGAGTGYSIILTVATGSSLTILDTSNSSWYRVRTSSGKEGYMSSDYIKVSSSAAAPSTPSTPSTPSSSSIGTGTTTDYLNLRTGAGTSYSIITTLSKGASVTVLQSLSGWYKVTASSGKTGYVSASYLSVKLNSSSSTPSTPTTSTDKVLGTAVTTDYLNFRTGAGTGYSIISTLPTGTQVSILDTSNSTWYKVKNSAGTTGYLCTDYLRVTLTPTVTPTPQPEVKPVTISLSATDKTLAVGQAYSLVATVANNGSTVPDCSSSDTAVASVKYASNSSGKYTYTVSAVGNGTATVNIYVGSVSKTFSVKVNGFAKTTTGVNFRTGASLSSSVIDVLATGTFVTIIDASDSEWIKVKTTDGTVGYLYSEYITYVSGDTGTITLSHSSASIPMGKTMYIKATASANSSAVFWKSDDESVAKVANGYIYAVSQGSTTIRATDATGANSASCSVTVTAAEGVKFVYTTPNIVSTGTDMQAIAITDTAKEAVKFVVYNKDGTTENYEVDSYTEETNEASGSLSENNTRVFSQTLNFAEAGEYTIRAYGYNGSSWSSDYKEMTAFVVSTQDKTTEALGKRRASDEILNIIATFEGYRAGVYADSLAYGIPTMGYGYVLSTGEQFYNNLTKKEAWALLCSTVNNKSYTTQVNKFVVDNGIKISQGEFDSLVSFSYNIGAGYWNNMSSDCTLRDMMLNSVDITELDFSQGGGYAATVEVSANVYRNIGDTTPATSVSYGQSVTVIDAKHTSTATENSTWYKIRLSSGGEYWVRNVYISINNKKSFTLNLEYVDAVAFGSEMLEWHVAGGVCIPGLLYRRLAEAKTFSFADYSEASPSSARYRVNTYKYFYPKCLAGYEE